MKYISSIIVFLIVHSAFADIEKFNNRLATMTVFGEAPGYGLQFKSSESNREVRYVPAVSTLLGLGISIHRWFGFSITTKTGRDDKDKLQKGDTAYTDYRFNIAFEKFLVNLNYQRYSGFYVENTDQIDSAVAAQNIYLQQPNMSLESIGASAAYVFDSEKYSLPAAVDQTQRQESSAGSWLLGISYADIVFDNAGQSLVPQAVRTQFGSDQNLTNGRFRNYTIDGGYGYTLVAKKFFFVAIRALYGLGLQERFTTGTDNDKHGWYSTSRLAGALSTGYNGDDFLATVALRFEGNSFYLNSMNIASNVWTVRFGMGTRF